MALLLHSFLASVVVNTHRMFARVHFYLSPAGKCKCKPVATFRRLFALATSLACKNFADFCKRRRRRRNLFGSKKFVAYI